MQKVNGTGRKKENGQYSDVCFFFPLRPKYSFGIIGEKCKRLQPKIELLPVFPTNNNVMFFMWTFSV